MILSQIILLIDNDLILRIRDIPVIYYFIGLSLILPKIPFIGKIFHIINTLMHEFGHAIMTLFLQGKVYSIEIFGDTSGSTTTQSANKFTSFLIAISGYLFSSSFSWISFYILDLGYHLYFIIGLSVLFFIMLLLWVRNRFGLIWILLFCLLNGLLIYYAEYKWIKYVALFYATIILVESISSTLVLLYLSLFKTKESGDAYNLQRMTHIPAFIWAFGFVAFACFVGYYIFKNFIL